MQDSSPFLANFRIFKTINALSSIRGMDDLLDTAPYKVIAEKHAELMGDPYLVYLSVFCNVILGTKKGLLCTSCFRERCI